MRGTAKYALDALSRLLLLPVAACCALERRLAGPSERVFSTWAQLLALVPGPPGVFLRRAFYTMTLDRACHSFYVGFGSCFTHRRVVVEPDVFVGTYALVGCSVLRRGCMVGSRASLLSGPALHELDGNGRWGPANLQLAQQIEIGEYALIGEGAIVMADVGESAMVAAGAVVSAPVPHRTVVAGNPARFVRRFPLPCNKVENAEVQFHGEAIPSLH